MKGLLASAYCIQNSGVPTHHCISERVAQAQDCHENTGENVSSAHPDLQQSTCTPWYESLCEVKPQNSKKLKLSRSQKMCFVALILSHVRQYFLPFV